MRTPVIAIVLWIFAATAQAQCVAQSGGAAADTAKAGAVTVSAQPGPQLIKTAAAQTHDRTLSLDDGLPAVSEKTAAGKTGDELPGGHGTIALLATLAVMSGIALRRYIARMK